jgi:hypothetical protein
MEKGVRMSQNHGKKKSQRRFLNWARTIEYLQT